MTQEDFQAVTELVEESAFGSVASRTLSDLTRKVGNLDRERHKEISAVFFLRLMQHLGGTFVWHDGPKAGNKYANVFQALSAEMPEFLEKSLVDKAEHVQNFGPKLQTGFYAARKWLFEWFEETVFCVPRHKESGVLAVITFDHNLRLGDGTPSAPTAAEMQQIRDEKLMTGQVFASAKRIGAAVKNKNLVRTRINDIVERALSEIETRKGSKLIADE